MKISKYVVEIKEEYIEKFFVINKRRNDKTIHCFYIIC